MISLVHLCISTRHFYFPSLVPLTSSFFSKEQKVEQVHLYEIFFSIHKHQPLKERNIINSWPDEIIITWQPKQDLGMGDLALAAQCWSTRPSGRLNLVALFLRLHHLTRTENSDEIGKLYVWMVNVYTSFSFLALLPQCCMISNKFYLVLFKSFGNFERSSTERSIQQCTSSYAQVLARN